MSKVIRLIAIFAMGWVGVAACASQHPTSPQASAPGSTKPVSTIVSVAGSTTASPGATPSTASTATSTPACVGLSICDPPPPDAEGNPPCFYSDGWQATTDGGIEVWYFHEPQNMSVADKVTAVVRKKDGTTVNQEADVAAGQQVHRFEFPTIDKSVVAEVFFDTARGRCFVIGPGS